jgi:hypothetical protein
LASGSVTLTSSSSSTQVSSPELSATLPVSTTRYGPAAVATNDIRLPSKGSRSARSTAVSA